MNWGWKISLVYIAFAAMMISFVVRARHHRVDLVAPDYYEQELKFQQQIDATKNVNSLAEKPVVITTPDSLIVRLPGFFSGKKVTGQVRFYCPSDSRNDKTHELIADETHEQKISTAEMIPGTYLFKLDWSSDGKSYYFEQPILIY